MRTDAVMRRTERWFVRQGVPTFIDPYRFASHILPRMLPILGATVVASVASLVLVSTAGAGEGTLVLGLTIFAVVLGVPALLARVGSRLPSLSRRAATAVVVAYAVAPLVLPVPIVLAYGPHRAAEAVGRPNASVAEIVGLSALALAVGFAAIFALAWAVAAYGLVPLAVRAVGHALSDMRNGLDLQGRALPTLLFVTLFIFFTAELWQLMDHLGWWRLALVLALFAAVTVLATATRLRGEIIRVEQDLSEARLRAACAGTPLEACAPTSVDVPPALTRRQATNLVIVLATRQLIQGVVVGLGLFAFFILLGLIIVDDATARLWIGDAPQRSAWLPFIPVALFRAATLLAGFGSMYFAITAMTQDAYRREFFEPVVEDVERALAVRAVYLDVRGRLAPDSAAST